MKFPCHGDKCEIGIAWEGSRKLLDRGKQRDSSIKNWLPLS